MPFKKMRIEIEYEINVITVNTLIQIKKIVIKIIFEMFVIEK